MRVARVLAVFMFLYLRPAKVACDTETLTGPADATVFPVNHPLRCCTFRTTSYHLHMRGTSVFWLLGFNPVIVTFTL